MQNFTNNKQKPLFLLAPLDWGLGHTTRCIPLIAELILQDIDVLIACNSMQKKILQAEFPQLNFVELEGYSIRYGKMRFLTILGLIQQIPKLLIKIKAEQAWLRSFLTKNRVQCIISDNRYGLYAENIPSVFITHQLAPISGFGKFADHVMMKMLYRYINRFTSCWIPDNSQDNTLAGKLSHPDQLPRIPVQYIGPLSRFMGMKTATSGQNLLLLLSGPEPQRTILENLLLAQCDRVKRNIVLVRGLPGDAAPPAQRGNLVCYNHLAANELAREINQAAVVISRAGYTSIMDLIALHKKMILIPTPGQTEQEYLGNYLHQHHVAYLMPQHSIDLNRVETVLENFPFTNRFSVDETYKKVILTHINTLKEAQAV